MRRGIGLDIGTDSIKLVELVRRGARLTAVTAAVLPLTPTAVGASEVETEVIKTALLQLIADYHLANAEVAVAVPGTMAFVRPITPLLTKRQQLEQAVRFEAQHTIPFKLEDVMWDYQVLSRDRLTNPEVLLGGVKRELIEQHIALLTSVRLRPTLIGISPLAVYNTVTEQYPPGPAPQAALNIGRQHTDLVIYRHQHVWVRSVPVGGERLTHALQERWQLSRDEAELVKVGGINRYTPEERWQVLQPPLQELSDELKRSLDYYQSQYAATASSAVGEPLQQLLLCGGTAHLERLTAYLQEQLGCRVTLFNPLASFAVNVTTIRGWEEGRAGQFAVAAGLALQQLGRGRAALDILRGAKQQRRAGQQRRVMLAMTAMTCAVMLGSYVWAVGRNYTNKRTLINQLNDQARVYEQHQPQIKVLLAQNEQQEQNIAVLYALVRDRGLWLELMTVLERLMPSTMWLTEISTTAAESAAPTSVGAAPAALTTAGAQPLLISGRALSFEAVNQFVYQLRSSPWFADVKPLSSNIKRDAVTEQEQVEFSIQCRPAPPPRPQAAAGAASHADTQAITDRHHP